MFRDEPFGFAARGAVAFRHSANMARKADFLKEGLEELFHKANILNRSISLRNFTLKNSSRKYSHQIT